MKLKSKTRGKYTIITVYHSLKVISDLTELHITIEKYLKENIKYIAVNFSDATYLYSGAISVLITCYRMIKEKGGNLCIIEPHQRILELLTQMNIDSLISIYSSEDDLIKEDCLNNAAAPKKIN